MIILIFMPNCSNRLEGLKDPRETAFIVKHKELEARGGN